MKLCIAATTLSLASAFTTPRFANVKSNSHVILRDTSADLGTPCVEECAITSFPNMPESVHPGVVTGEALVDLLNHAKENGEFLWIIWYWFIGKDGCGCHHHHEHHVSRVANRRNF